VVILRQTLLTQLIRPQPPAVNLPVVTRPAFATVSNSVTTQIEKLQQQQQSIMRRIFLTKPYYPFIAIQGMRGCIPLDEFIYTPNGLAQVKDVYDGMPIHGGYIQAPHFFEDDVYKVTIDNIEFLATAEHPLWVIKDFPFRNENHKKGRWITVGEIYQHYSTKKGKDSRWYAQKYLSNQFKCNEISIGKNFAKLLGYLMSDGYFSETQSVKFTNVNKDLLEDVVRLSFDVAEQFAFSLKFYQKGNGQDVMFTGVHGKNQSLFKDKLRELGVIDRTTFGKLQLLKEDELGEFIKGYFNGDGTLIFANRAYVAFYVGVHKRQAVELQFMLWRLDISSSIKHRKRAADHEGCWEVTVGDRRSLLKLLSILEDRKYPEKFKEARKRIESMGTTSQHFKTESHEWLPITRIEKVGRQMVAGWQTLPSHEIISYDGLRTHNSGKSAKGERICEIYYQRGYVILDWWASIDLENAFWCVPGKLDKDRINDPYALNVGYPVLLIVPKSTEIIPRRPLCRCGVPIDAHGSDEVKCKKPFKLIETITDDKPLKEIIEKAYYERRICVLSPGFYRDKTEALRTLAKFLRELPDLITIGVIPSHISMVLFMRELGNIAPQGLQNYGRGLEAAIKRPLQQLVREARHLRIVLIGDFQRSSDIAKTIVAQRDYLLFSRITRDLITDQFQWIYDAVLYRKTRARESMDFETFYSLQPLSNIYDNQFVAVWPDNYWTLTSLRMAGFKHKKPDDSWSELANCSIKYVDPAKQEKKKSEEMRQKELQAEERLRKLKVIHQFKQQGRDWPWMIMEVKWEGFGTFLRPEPATEEEKEKLAVAKNKILSAVKMAYSRARTKGLLDPEGANANTVVTPASQTIRPEDNRTQQ